MRRRWSSELRALPELHGRHQRPADPEPAGQPGHRSRQGLDARCHARSRSRTPCSAPTATAGSRRSTRPNNQYKVIMVLGGPYQRDPNALSLLYVRSSNGQLVPLSAVASLTENAGPLTVNHAGQLPAVTISFNLRPGASLGEAVDKINAIARQTLPATITTSFQGTAQAFESSLSGLWLLLRRGHPGDLHRPRHPVRELHPPDHDPVRSAVGRLRRAADADALPCRAEHLRLRRRHHADRHRQEERHHADRLRARRAAHRRQGGARSDLRRLRRSASVRS